MLEESIDISVGWIVMYADMMNGRYMCQPIIEPAALRGRVLLDLTAPEVH